VDIFVELLDGIEEVEIANDVVDLGHDCMFAVDHGERRRPLLAEVDDGFRLEFAHEALHERVVDDVADEELDVAASELAPAVDTLADGGNGREVSTPRVRSQ